MTDTCQYCHTEIMKVGDLWYRKRTADINGYCPSPDSPDDRHRP